MCKCDRKILKNMKKKCLIYLLCVSVFVVIGVVVCCSSFLVYASVVHISFPRIVSSCSFQKKFCVKRLKNLKQNHSTRSQQRGGGEVMQYRIEHFSRAPTKCTNYTYIIKQTEKNRNRSNAYMNICSTERERKSHESTLYDVSFSSAFFSFLLHLTCKFGILVSQSIFTAFVHRLNIWPCHDDDDFCTVRTHTAKMGQRLLGKAMS